MMENPHLQVAMFRLNQFLELKGYRRTQERNTILEEIYGETQHFHFDAIYLKDTLERKGFHLSMATVYNTLELFVEVGLIKKHQFGTQNSSHYERSVGSGQHDHVVCLDCGFVKEFCDPRIQQIEDSVSEWFMSRVTQHSLVLYGHCTDQLCNRQRIKNTN
ncbi:MAG: transcriptional repressor [Spirosomataceae bacterium]